MRLVAAFILLLAFCLHAETAREREQSTQIANLTKRLAALDAQAVVKQHEIDGLRVQLSRTSTAGATAKAQADSGKRENEALATANKAQSEQHSDALKTNQGIKTSISIGTENTALIQGVNEVVTAGFKSQTKLLAIGLSVLMTALVSGFAFIVRSIVRQGDDAAARKIESLMAIVARSSEAQSLSQNTLIGLMEKKGVIHGT